MNRPTALIKEETDMRVFLRRLTAAVLLILCLAPAALAEDAFDVTLARGERWTIPEDRLGGCAISDETVVSLDAGQLVGLRPGRAEVRLSGEQPTLLRVLVLYAEAEPAVETDGESAPPAAQTDYRYYAVSDTDDEDEPAEQAQDIEPASTDSAEPADVPEDEEAEAADEPQTEPEALPEEPAADAGADAAAASDDLTVQAYDRSAVPDAINTVIDFALNEWREAGNKTFSRAGSKNKYSFWQCGKGAKCNIGWCGAFLGYVFDTCGIPMDEPTKSVPHESGEPYSVHAAGVGKINKGFEKMNRLSTLPRPGYLVVYGEQKGYGYKHIGLVTDVDDLGNGVYLLKTVEGNMSNRIKRYCYLYDTNEALKNTRPCPDEYRKNDGEINDYEHIKKWRVTTFCQTWF